MCFEAWFTIYWGSLIVLFCFDGHEDTTNMWTLVQVLSPSTVLLQLKHFHGYHYKMMTSLAIWQKPLLLLRRRPVWETDFLLWLVVLQFWIFIPFQNRILKQNGNHKWPKIFKGLHFRLIEMHLVLKTRNVYFFIFFNYPLETLWYKNPNPKISFETEIWHISS